MPTWEEQSRFRRDYRKLPTGDRVRLRAAVRQFVSDLKTPGTPFRSGLRVKGVAGHSGVFELTWAPDGRATFEYGDAVRPGEAHVIWRRCGGHEIFDDP